MWVTAVIAAPLAWAAGAWVLAAVASVVAVTATWVLPVRWHQLSRRWFVAVPAGLVVHDPVVLAETVMIPRARITRVGLVGAARGNGAFDMTGPTPGVAIGVALDAMITATLAPRRDSPRGTAIHLSALLVAPTRPGAVLREAVPAPPPGGLIRHRRAGSWCVRADTSAPCATARTPSLPIRTLDPSGSAGPEDEGDDRWTSE